jgi:hypothetical protein
VEIFIGGKDGFSGAGMLYRTGSAAEEKARLAGPTVKAVLAAAAKSSKVRSQLPKGLAAALAVRGMKAARRSGGKGAASRLWYWLEDARDLKSLVPLAPGRVILPLTPANVKEMQRMRRKGAVRTVWSLPPLLYPLDGERLRKLAASLVSKGFEEFMCATLSGLALLRDAAGGSPVRIYSDYRMGFLNRFAAEALYSLGIDAACASAETDSLTWNRLLEAPFRGGTLCYLTGRPALFTSRLIPAVSRGVVESPKGERFWAARDGESFVLLPEAKVFMGGFLKGPELPNLAGYVVDLRRERNPAAVAAAVRKAVAEGRRAAGSGFNFKRGLG